MMTPEQIAAMRADAEAGTPGPWAYRPRELDDWGVVRGSDGLVVAQASTCRESGNLDSFRTAGTDPAGSNARNIARVPDMIATILAQAAEIDAAKAEIAKLQEMLAVQWEGIPWRDGPPPVEWRDGRDVALFSINGRASILCWRDGVWSDVVWYLRDDQITHHAALTKPGETL